MSFGVKVSLGVLARGLIELIELMELIELIELFFPALSRLSFCPDALRIMATLVFFGMSLGIPLVRIQFV